MKSSSIFLLIASVICSSWAYPASGNPDDEVEVISGGGGSQQPGYQPPNPSVPSIPNYPQIPTIPSIPSVPVYPSYPYPAYPSYPSYPIYPTYSTYFPLSWSYNSVYNGFSNLVQSLRNQASTAWSQLPSIRPLISSYWPSADPNGSTTSTVQIVGDHKFIINETVHVQKGDFGHVVFKVRTVDIKPIGETTEGVDNESTEIPPGVDIDQPPQTTQKPRENTNDDDDDRVSVIVDNGDIDGVPASSPELFTNGNEIPVSTLEDFEANTLNTDNISASEDKKQSLAIKTAEKTEIESFSSGMENHKSNEWSEIELDNIDDKKNTYYQVNNENSGEEMENDDVEMVTHDLTDDIAINQMLADQGAPYNPYAEVFDINQFDLGRDAPKITSHENKQMSEQESFDYQPYHHQNVEKQPSTIK